MEELAGGFASLFLEGFRALDPRLRLRGATSGHATRQPGGRRARRARPRSRPSRSGLATRGPRPSRVLHAGLRDAIYKLVARNRIWLFGAVDTCRRATKEDKKHFL